MGKGGGDNCSARPATDVQAMEMTREERQVMLHGGQVRAVLAKYMSDRPWSQRSNKNDAYQRAVDGTRGLPYAAQDKLATIYAENHAFCAPFEPRQEKARVCVATGELVVDGVCPTHGKDVCKSEMETVTIPASHQVPDEMSREYALRARERDEAKKALTFYNQRWIIKEAHTNSQFQGRGVSPEELIQAGNEGMLEAVEQYDVSRGYTFLTYAKTKVRMRMQRLCENEASRIRGVRPPSDVENEIVEVKRALAALERKSNSEPTVEDVQAAINERRRDLGLKSGDIKAERVQQAWELARARPVSMQSTLRSDDGDATEFGELLQGSSDTFAEAAQSEVFSMVTEALDTMQPDERVVMEAYLGLSNGQEMKTREIADQMGLKPAQVRDLQAAGEAALHRTFAAHGHNVDSLMSLASS
jgi:RNA polymerase sigma factor (sigma-70 family)